MDRNTKNYIKNNHNKTEDFNMKVAVASEGKVISGHFGHCEGFLTYDVENKNAVNPVFIPNPGHKPGFLPVFLKEQNVDAIIAGGMGEAAVQLFEENDIEVFVGIQGSAEEAAQKFAQGILTSTGSICTEHNH